MTQANEMVKQTQTPKLKHFKPIILDGWKLPLHILLGPQNKTKSSLNPDLPAIQTSPLKMATPCLGATTRCTKDAGNHYIY